MNNTETVMSNEQQERIVWIDVDRLNPHPDNPRKELGDLEELAASIKAKGILQNLTVVERNDGDYMIIIGHRRYAASRIAGLTKLPCVVADMTPAEQVQTMLLENMQRSDLTVYEQAQGFQMMLDFGSTIDEIAEKTGFSQTTVRRRVKMMELDQTKLKEVSSRQLSLGDFDTLAQIEDIKERNKVLESIGTSNFNRAVEGAIRKQGIAKNLSAIKAEIKRLHAVKIKYSETYGNTYDQVGSTIYIADWDGAQFSVSTNKKLYYYLDEDWGKLGFYIKRDKAASVRRSDEEIEKEHIAREAYEKLKEAAAIHFKLRKDFANTISVTAKNRATIMLWMAKMMTYSIRYYIHDSGIQIACQELQIDPEEYKDKDIYQIICAALESNEDLIPKLVMCFLGDNETLNYYNIYDYELKDGKLPRHCKNSQLDLIYGFLCAMGYEMSDEEKSVRDGTSPYYAVEEQKNKSEA